VARTALSPRSLTAGLRDSAGNADRVPDLFAFLCAKVEKLPHLGEHGRARALCLDGGDGRLHHVVLHGQRGTSTSRWSPSLRSPAVLSVVAINRLHSVPVASRSASSAAVLWDSSTESCRADRHQRTHHHAGVPMQIVHGLALITCQGVAVGAESTPFGTSACDGGRDAAAGLGLPPRASDLRHPPAPDRLRPPRARIGGNARPRGLAGIPVVRTRVHYIRGSGTGGGLAGVILAARLGSGQPNTSGGSLSTDLGMCAWRCLARRRRRHDAWRDRGVLMDGARSECDEPREGEGPSGSYVVREGIFGSRVVRPRAATD